MGIPISQLPVLPKTGISPFQTPPSTDVIYDKGDGTGPHTYQSPLYASSLIDAATGKLIGSPAADSLTVTQPGHGFIVGDAIYKTVTSGVWLKALAVDSTQGEALGLVTDVNGDKFVVQFSGLATIGGVNGLDSLGNVVSGRYSSLSEGQLYYLDSATRPSSVLSATSVLTGSLTSNVSSGNVVVIGGTSYTFRNVPAAQGDVQIDFSAAGNSGSLTNLASAINGTGKSGAPLPITGSGIYSSGGTNYLKLVFSSLPSFQSGSIIQLANSTLGNPGVTVNVGGCSVSSASINLNGGGAGYVLGDILTPTGGAALVNATLQVQGITGTSGSPIILKSIQVTAGGTGYSVGDVFTYNGSGTGALSGASFAFQVTSVSGGQITGVSISNVGSFTGSINSSTGTPTVSSTQGSGLAYSLSYAKAGATGGTGATFGLIFAGSISSLVPTSGGSYLLGTSPNPPLPPSGVTGGSGSGVSVTLTTPNLTPGIAYGVFFATVQGNVPGSTNAIYATLSLGGNNLAVVSGGTIASGTTSYASSSNYFTGTTSSSALVSASVSTTTTSTSLLVSAVPGSGNVNLSETSSSLSWSNSVLASAVTQVYTNSYQSVSVLQVTSGSNTIQVDSIAVIPTGTRVLVSGIGPQAGQSSPNLTPFASYYVNSSAGSSAVKLYGSLADALNGSGTSLLVFGSSATYPSTLGVTRPQLTVGAPGLSIPITGKTTNLLNVTLASSQASAFPKGTQVSISGIDALPANSYYINPAKDSLGNILGFYVYTTVQACTSDTANNGTGAIGNLGVVTSGSLSIFLQPGAGNATTTVPTYDTQPYKKALFLAVSPTTVYILSQRLTVDTVKPYQDFFQPNSSFSLGSAVYRTAGGWALSDSLQASTANVDGIITSADGLGNYRVTFYGLVNIGSVPGIYSGGLIQGATYYLASSTTLGAGNSIIDPSQAVNWLKPLFVALSPNWALVKHDTPVSVSSSLPSALSYTVGPSTCSIAEGNNLYFIDNNQATSTSRLRLLNMLTNGVQTVDSYASLNVNGLMSKITLPSSAGPLVVKNRVYFTSSTGVYWFDPSLQSTPITHKVISGDYSGYRVMDYQMNSSQYSVFASIGTNCAFTCVGFSATPIANGGSNYQVGDIVTLDGTGGTIDATAQAPITAATQFQVTSVSSGAVTGLSIYNNGSYATAPTVKTTTFYKRTNGNTGTGSGLQVNAVFSSSLTSLKDRLLISDRGFRGNLQTLNNFQAPLYTGLAVYLSGIPGCNFDSQLSTGSNLVSGSTYTITSYATGDDFTGTGAVSDGASGWKTNVPFVATGVQPTTWSSGTVLTTPKQWYIRVDKTYTGGIPNIGRAGGSGAAGFRGYAVTVHATYADALSGASAQPVAATNIGVANVTVGNDADNSSITDAKVVEWSLPTATSGASTAFAPTGLTAPNSFGVAGAVMTVLSIAQDGATINSPLGYDHPNLLLVQAGGNLSQLSALSAKVLICVHPDSAIMGGQTASWSSTSVYTDSGVTLPKFNIGSLQTNGQNAEYGTAVCLQYNRAQRKLYIVGSGNFSLCLFSLSSTFPGSLYEWWTTDYFGIQVVHYWWPWWNWPYWNQWYSRYWFPVWSWWYYWYRGYWNRIVPYTKYLYVLDYSQWSQVNEVALRGSGMIGSFIQATVDYDFTSGSEQSVVLQSYSAISSPSGVTRSTWNSPKSLAQFVSGTAATGASLIPGSQQYANVGVGYAGATYYSAHSGLESSTKVKVNASTITLNPGNPYFALITSANPSRTFTVADFQSQSNWIYVGYPAYVYVAYASDAKGSNFSLSPAQGNVYWSYFVSVGALSIDELVPSLFQKNWSALYQKYDSNWTATVTNNGVTSPTVPASVITASYGWLNPGTAAKWIGADPLGRTPTNGYTDFTTTFQVSNASSVVNNLVGSIAGLNYNPATASPIVASQSNSLLLDFQYAADSDVPANPSKGIPAGTQVDFFINGVHTGYDASQQGVQWRRWHPVKINSGLWTTMFDSKLGAWTFVGIQAPFRKLAPANLIAPTNSAIPTVSGVGGTGGILLISSGALTVGATYTIVSYSAGDDFTNVGANSNASGITFIATGATPSSWSGSSLSAYNDGTIRSGIIYGSNGSLTISGLTAGGTYYWSPGVNDYGIVIPGFNGSGTNGAILPPALPSAETVNGGTLIIGNTYTIQTKASGDDFTNVGAAGGGSAGQTFVATSATPNVWSYGSVLVNSVSARTGVQFTLPTGIQSVALYGKSGAVSCTAALFQMNTGGDYSSTGTTSNTLTVRVYEAPGIGGPPSGLVVSF